MPAPHKRTPHWHPIASLPLIADVIDGQLEGAEEQHRLLLQAQPGSLDDATVEGVVRVFTEEHHFQGVPRHLRGAARPVAEGFADAGAAA